MSPVDVCVFHGAEALVEGKLNFCLSLLTLWNSTLYSNKSEGAFPTFTGTATH